jgi:hypothetical protein
MILFESGAWSMFVRRESIDDSYEGILRRAARAARRTSRNKLLKLLASRRKCAYGLLVAQRRFAEREAIASSEEAYDTIDIHWRQVWWTDL